MRAILAVRLCDRLGSGMWKKLHMTSLHVDGKVWIPTWIHDHSPMDWHYLYKSSLITVLNFRSACLSGY